MAEMILGSDADEKKPEIKYSVVDSFLIRRKS
jgi:hypothetical protein